MDQRLVAWARAVKARAARRGVTRRPTLWLFTDAARLPDPRPAARRMPAGIGGVVLRHDGAADRAALARDLMRICRTRRLGWAVAGNWRLAARVGAGFHAREGRTPAGAPRWLRVVTASAHGGPALRRAHARGALAFLSPAFATASHPGARALGAARWRLMARRSGGAGALGGLTAATIRQLGRNCVAAGAIGALT